MRHTFESLYLSYIVSCAFSCTILFQNRVDRQERLNNSSDSLEIDLEEINKKSNVMSMMAHQSQVLSKGNENRIHPEEKLKQGIAISLGCSAAFNSNAPVKYGIADRKSSPRSQHAKNFERYLSESSMRHNEYERVKNPAIQEQIVVQEKLPQKSAVKAAIAPTMTAQPNTETLFNLDNFRNELARSKEVIVEQRNPTPLANAIGNVTLNPDSEIEQQQFMSDKEKSGQSIKPMENQSKTGNISKVRSKFDSLHVGNIRNS